MVKESKDYLRRRWYESPL